ncbi:MAG: endolytic transglycosylase MltG [Clostridia bacterium]|nr:endolytic transglycosylase MltG [Clostridia bacterium]
MSDERKDHISDQELDDMLKELDGEIQTARTTEPRPVKRPSARIRLEDSGARAASSDYVDLEAQSQTAAAPSAVSAVPLEPEDDVTVFPEKRPDAVQPKSSGDTQVMDEAEMTQALPETMPRSASPKKKKEKKKKNREALGCLRTIIYLVFVLAAACALACIGYVAVIDVSGIGKSSIVREVVIPEEATTEEIAEILKAEQIIDQPLIFRAYSRLTHADGMFHPGVHTLSANMGYASVINELQTEEERKTVTVTIPEGATIDTIASLMEENNVCSKEDFYSAIVLGNYDDYEFIAELTAQERQNRVYLLEGYLFPDTYEFYQEGAAETAIRKMLDGFSSRVNADTRAVIKASGRTLNEVLIEASIAQKEAARTDDMPRVVRVLLNRLQNPAEFPKLQFDSTEDYLLNLVPRFTGGVVIDTAYNTYEREGLPVGPICNPGLDAINAAINPSEEDDIVGCYYFASIIETGETAFFEYFDDFEAWCIEHDVGMYANY